MYSIGSQGAKIRGLSYLENKIIPEADIVLFLNLIEDLKSSKSFKGIDRPPSLALPGPINDT